ncbi:hypothetical protein PHMEG_00024599 [Phytophthora megakarya]|uniref:Uncharacterized protein n=1 Tax=Phytophthora megakarya TaxID=4795 RepID=A0A225VEU0_9STRA|nr:hypothetical protein PHMEG_00024599 [Phytophthora megakarya]
MSLERVKRSYNIKFKRQVISRVDEIGIDASIKGTKVPHRAMQGWLVTTRTLIEYMKSHQHTWLVEYLQTQKSEDSG